MENYKNKKSVKFQGDMLNFCDFIQVFVFTPNHHLKVALHLYCDVIETDSRCNSDKIPSKDSKAVLHVGA